MVNFKESVIFDIHNKLYLFSWVQNTYYIPANKSIPHLEEEREGNQIKYYQWVTFVLLFQAFMFYIPRIFWTTFSARCGFFIGDLVNSILITKACLFGET
jgi:hypothetical protein